MFVISARRQFGGRFDRRVRNHEISQERKGETISIRMLCEVEWLWCDQWILLILACLALLALAILSRHKFTNKQHTGITKTKDKISTFSLAKMSYRRKHRESLVERLSSLSPSKWRNQCEPDTGLTLLLCSCLGGQRKCVEHLLSNGSDVGAVSSRGDTALILATFACCTVKGADPAIIDLLACRGVDANVQNEYGDSALSIAAMFGRKDLLSILLQYGASVNTASSTGYFPVDFAKYSGSRESIKLLTVNNQ